MKKFIIKSNSRNSYFIAMHSFTPFYGEKEQAQQFNTLTAAHTYAMIELFTVATAFTIEDIQSN